MSQAAVVILLLDAIDEAFDKKSWHGTNLRGSLRGLTARQAAWRPGHSRHNVWEIAVHAAYWKYAVRRRLTGEKRGSFSLKGSNWFCRPVAATEAAWQEDVALLVMSTVSCGTPSHTCPWPLSQPGAVRPPVLRGSSAA